MKFKLWLVFMIKFLKSQKFQRKTLFITDFDAKQNV
jgi:hypothetical protein